MPPALYAALSSWSSSRKTCRGPWRRRRAASKRRLAMEHAKGVAIGQTKEQARWEAKGRRRCLPKWKCSR
eukprot:6180598-Pleurochrysis_carterae.AAC.2